MRESREQSGTVLVITSLASFLTPFMGSATTVALPAMGTEFGLGAVPLGWVATAYILAAAVFLVPFGRLADTHGRKPVFAAGLAVFALGSALSALAHSFPFLILGRVVQGIGGAMTFGTATAILVAAVPPERRGHMLGINVATVYLGLSLGPVLGGVLTRYLGWRSIFWVTAPLALAVAVLAFVLLAADSGTGERARFDVAGSVVYALALPALMYGFSVLPGALGFALVATGIAGIVAFVIIELRRANPVLDVRLFAGNQVFTLSSVAAFVNYSATSAVGFLVSLYLQYVRGLAPEQAGIVLVAAPAVQALFSPIAGRLSDRVEPRVVASVGMALTALGLGSLCFLGARTPLVAVVASLGLLGMGFGLFSSPNTNAIMSSVERCDYGVAASVVATVRMIGQMLSMGVVLVLFALLLGRVEIERAAAGRFLLAMRAAFAVFVVLCGAGVFASLARGRLRPGEPASECAR